MYRATCRATDSKKGCPDEINYSCTCRMASFVRGWFQDEHAVRYALQFLEQDTDAIVICNRFSDPDRLTHPAFSFVSIRGFVSVWTRDAVVVSFRSLQLPLRRRFWREHSIVDDN